MKPIHFRLITSCHMILQFLAGLCESFMSYFGLIKWASNRSSSNYYNAGTVGRQIFYTRFGKAYIRSSPAQFKIKDPRVWEKRWSKFSAFFDCARFMNNDLSSLFQDKENGRSWFNNLCSHLSHFWVRQSDGAFVFSPGFADVSIGNGTMPDVRDVDFSSPATDTLKVEFNDSILFLGKENNDDNLQLMFIDQDGKQSFWIDLTSVTRSSGSATFIISPSFGARIYPSIKFKAGAQLAGKIKGIFRFPQGMLPVTILR